MVAGGLSSSLPGYERSGVYAIESVLKWIEESRSVRKGELLVDFDGDLMDMSSMRYRVFKRSLSCVVCGLVGGYFAKERDIRMPRMEGRPLKWHFNLYGMRDGVEVLMTKDHIVPVCRGGGNVFRNFQTMCSVCNGIKGGG